MSGKIKIIAIAAASLAIASAPLLASTSRSARTPAAAPAPSPADVIKMRKDGFRQMGGAFKSIRDSLALNPVPMPAMQQAANTIKNHSQSIYRWFPANSGPQSGIKTSAKADIWAKPAEFRTAQDNLARAATGFQAAVASGNVDTIKAAIRPLGMACKGCHDQFKNEEHEGH